MPRRGTWWSAPRSAAPRAPAVGRLPGHPPHSRRLRGLAAQARRRPACPTWRGFGRDPTERRSGGEEVGARRGRRLRPRNCRRLEWSICGGMATLAYSMWPSVVAALAGLDGAVHPPQVLLVAPNQGRGVAGVLRQRVVDPAPPLWAGHQAALRLAPGGGQAALGRVVGSSTVPSSAGRRTGHRRLRRPAAAAACVGARVRRRWTAA